ncbi:MAG: hypothetical protein RR364_04075 [Lachnospiraceae bacterium]
MTGLLEIKANIIRFVEKYEIYLLPVLKFIFALTAFLLINWNLGYMQKLNHPFIPLILAAICCLLPPNAIVLVGGVLVLGHLYALSMEACLVAFLVFMISFLLYFRIAPKTGYQSVLTPMLFTLRVPYIQPIACGLLSAPYSIVSAMCGTVIYYFLKGIKENEASFRLANDDKMTSKFIVAINQIFGNKEMYIVLAAFAVTVLTVYLIRRRSIENSWLIAITVGSITQFLIILLGKLLTGETSGILILIIGSIVSMAVAFVIQFFMFHLDYSRAERVQFEDDSYYYYVKAIPKAIVQTKKKKVTKINSKSSSVVQKGTMTKESLAEEFDIDKDLLN